MWACGQDFPPAPSLQAGNELEVFTPRGRHRLPSMWLVVAEHRQGCLWAPKAVGRSCSIPKPPIHKVEQRFPPAKSRQIFGKKFRHRGPELVVHAGHVRGKDDIRSVKEYVTFR